MTTKSEVKVAIVDTLVTFDPEEFSKDNGGAERAQHIADLITERLDDLNALNLTDAAEVEEPAAAEPSESAE